MPTVKEQMTEVIQSLPDDASYDEIMRELAMECMIQRGLDDSRNDRVLSNKDLAQRIQSWQQ